MSPKGEKWPLLLSPNQASSHCIGQCPCHPPTRITPRTPECPAWFLPLCRPGSPAHTRTGDGGLPAPGPASQMAGHLHCTSCTRHPLLTGTARRCRLGQCGSTGGRQWADYVEVVRFLGKKHQNLWKLQRLLQSVNYFL